MADFRIDDEQFQEIIAQQVLNSISEETREKLISEALSFLMKEDNSYGRKMPSPIAQAFQQELVKVASKVANRVLTESRIQAEVEKAIESHIRVAIRDRGFDISHVIGRAIGDNLEIQFNSNN